VHLPLHLGDAGARPILRMHVALDGRVFPRAIRMRPIRWDAARCSRASTYNAPARRRLSNSARAPCADARSIGEHLDDVIFGRVSAASAAA